MKTKILFTVDIHGDEKYLKTALKKAKKCDLVVIVGDFTFFEEDMEEILKRFNNLNKTILVIHGNHEFAEELEESAKKYKYIEYVHKKFYEYKNMLLYFNGEGGFSDIDPGIDEEIPKVERRFEDFRKRHENAKTIIVFHAPPADTLLDLIDAGDHKESIGSISKKEMVCAAKPDYMIAGHVHDCNYQKDRIGNTILLNPGPKGRILKFKTD